MRPSWPSHTGPDLPAASLRNRCVQATARGWGRNYHCPASQRGKPRHRETQLWLEEMRPMLQPYTAAGWPWTYCVHQRGLSSLEML